MSNSTSRGSRLCCSKEPAKKIVMRLTVSALSPLIRVACLQSEFWRRIFIWATNFTKNAPKCFANFCSLYFVGPKKLAPPFCWAAERSFRKKSRNLKRSFRNFLRNSPRNSPWNFSYFPGGSKSPPPKFHQFFPIGDFKFQIKFQIKFHQKFTNTLLQAWQP